MSRDELRDQVATALGAGYTVRTGDELAASTAADGKAFLDIVRIVLLGFSGLSLLVGIFLILNTFSILVAQRTGELALMAALGRAAEADHRRGAGGGRAGRRGGVGGRASVSASGSRCC